MDTLVGFFPLFWLEEPSEWFLKKTHCSGCGYGTSVQDLFNDLHCVLFNVDIMCQVSRWKTDICVPECHSGNSLEIMHFR